MLSILVKRTTIAGAVIDLNPPSLESLENLLLAKEPRLSLEQVFSRMSKDEIREFWDKKRIIPNNWIELCAFLLKEEFSDDFTVPLLQTDNSFMLQVRIKLETHHIGLPCFCLIGARRYLQRFPLMRICTKDLIVSEQSLSLSLSLSLFLSLSLPSHRVSAA